MKKLLFFVLLFAGLNSSAQIAIRFLQFRPLGELGAVMKKTFTGEILYMDELEEGESRFRFGLSYASLKPRLDTFRIIAVKNSSNGTTILPGYQVFRKYNLFFLSGGMDYSFIERQSFSLYGGADVLIGGLTVDYDRHYDTYLSGSVAGGFKLIGLRLRAGTEYRIDNHSAVFLELSPSGYLIEESGIFTHNEISAGFQYLF